MSYIAIAFVAIVAVGAGWLAVQIVRASKEYSNLRADVADALTRANVEQILGWIEQIGKEPSQGCIAIIRGAGKPDGTLNLTLPDLPSEFPWSGKAVRVVAAHRRAESWPVAFKIESEDSESGISANSAIARWLAVPIIRYGRRKRRQNVFATERYLKLSAPLKTRLEELYPKNPIALLNFILSDDGRLGATEPFDQIRCGLPAAWIQVPRFHKCPQCRRPLRLILQVPGRFLASRVSEGTFYLFGCPSHPSQLVTEDDWG